MQSVAVILVLEPVKVIVLVEYTSYSLPEHLTVIGVQTPLPTTKVKVLYHVAEASKLIASNMMSVRRVQYKFFMMFFLIATTLYMAY